MPFRGILLVATAALQLHHNLFSFNDVKVSRQLSLGLYIRCYENNHSPCTEHTNDYHAWGIVTEYEYKKLIR